MKKLKLQKALLAICLALPITLNITNKINAMKINQGTHNEPTQQTDTDKAFTFQFWKYLKELRQKTKFKREQYATFFNNYIQDDIAKYIGVYLLILNQQIIPVNNPELAKLIDMEPIYTAFLNDVKGTQISKFWQRLHYIDEKKEKTKEDKLILLLCVPGWLDINDINDLYPHIIPAIDDYNREVINIKNKNATTQLIDSIAIESINQLIQLDYHYQKQLSAEPRPILQTLSELIQGITNAYKNKLKKLEQQQQQQDTQPGNAKTVDIAIKEIEKLINDWIKQKDKTNTEKEAKLQKLEQAIDSLEKKYNAIVKGKKVKRKQI